MQSNGNNIYLLTDVVSLLPPVSCLSNSASSTLAARPFSSLRKTLLSRVSMIMHILKKRIKLSFQGEMIQRKLMGDVSC